MATKKRIKIDEEKCTGCGKCVNACIGSALALVDGKAKLTREDYCDGMGVCIGECPSGAISFEDVEIQAAPTPEATPANPKVPASDEKLPCGCPGTMSRMLNNTPAATPVDNASSCREDNKTAVAAKSELNAWPIQLHLIRPEAPQFTGADVLIAASCSAFSAGNFHSEFLTGKSLIIACPKLDDQSGYLEKLTDLFAVAKPASVTVLRMEVPCCGGLSRLVDAARLSAASDIPVTEITISLEGEIKQKVNMHNQHV